jgi:hypothetical protein
MEKVKCKFNCELCNYNTNRSDHFKQHNVSTKHIYIKNGIISNNKLFACACGKQYMRRQGLHKHKKTCEYVCPTSDDIVENTEDDIVENTEDDIVENTEDDDTNYKAMFIALLKNNDKMVETMAEMVPKMVETMAEMVPKIGNNNNSNNNSHNKFNLNVFLNEKCKDAMTMDKFIEGIEISMKNLLTTKDKGLAEGISNIFVENMNKLSLHERPLHCTDTKRETLYIKNDKWEKDKDNKQVKGNMRAIAQKQVRSLNKWTEEHPDYMKVSHLQDEYSKLVKGISDTLDQNEEKVLKKVCDNVYLSDKGESMTLE